MRKRIMRRGEFVLAWTKEAWDWEAFMRLVYAEKLEGRVWFGMTDFDYEWEKYLRNWMQVYGDFFIVRKDGVAVGACWITDVEAGVGKFHFCMGDRGGAFVRMHLPEIFSALLKFGLERFIGPCYGCLVGTTPFVDVARLARLYGYGQYETIEGYFGNQPGYRLTISRENYDGRRRRRTETARPAKAPAAACTPADQGEQGRADGSGRRAEEAGQAEGP